MDKINNMKKSKNFKWEAEEFWDQLPDFGQKHTKKFLDKIEYRKEQYYENRRLRNKRKGDNNK